MYGISTFYDHSHIIVLTFCDCFWWVGIRSHSWEASFSTLSSVQLCDRSYAVQFETLQHKPSCFLRFYLLLVFHMLLQLCRHFALKMYSNICDPNYNWTLTIQHSLYWRQFTISRRLQLYFVANLVVLYVVWRRWHWSTLKWTSTHPITAMHIACILSCHQNLHFLLYKQFIIQWCTHDIKVAPLHSNSQHF
jgi:hypothetical protein